MGAESERSGAERNEAGHGSRSGSEVEQSGAERSAAGPEHSGVTQVAKTNVLKSLDFAIASA